MRFGNMLEDRVGMGLISLFMLCVEYVKVQFVSYLRCAGRHDESRMEWIKSCKKTKIVISNVTKYYFKNPSESFDETASRWRICHRRRSCFA